MKLGNGTPKLKIKHRIITSVKALTETKTIDFIVYTEKS